MEHSVSPLLRRQWETFIRYSLYFCHRSYSRCYCFVFLCALLSHQGLCTLVTALMAEEQSGLRWRTPNVPLMVTRHHEMPRSPSFLALREVLPPHEARISERLLCWRRLLDIPRVDWSDPNACLQLDHVIFVDECAYFREDFVEQVVGWEVTRQVGKRGPHVCTVCTHATTGEDHHTATTKYNQASGFIDWAAGILPDCLTQPVCPRTPTYHIIFIYIYTQYIYTPICSRLWELVASALPLVLRMGPV